MVTFLRCLLSISSILQRKLLVLGSKISLLASNLGLNTSKYSNNCMKWLKVRPLFFSPIMIVTVTITNVLCVTISSRDGSSFRWHFQKHFPPTYVALLKTIKTFHSSRWLFEFCELFMSTNVETVLSISGIFIVTLTLTTSKLQCPPIFELTGPFKRRFLLRNADSKKKLIDISAIFREM